MSWCPSPCPCPFNEWTNVHYASQSLIGAPEKQHRGREGAGRKEHASWNSALPHNGYAQVASSLGFSLFRCGVG